MNGNRRFYHHLFALLLMASCITVCKSGPTPRETVEAEHHLEEIEEASEAIVDAVESSNASPKVKAYIKTKTDEIIKRANAAEEIVKKQGKRITELEQEVEAKEDQVADLKIYRGIVWGFCAALGLVAIGFILKKIFTRLPIPLP